MIGIREPGVTFPCFSLLTSAIKGMSLLLNSRKFKSTFPFVDAPMPATILPDFLKVVIKPNKFSQLNFTRSVKLLNSVSRFFFDS